MGWVKTFKYCQDEWAPTLEWCLARYFHRCPFHDTFSLVLIWCLITVVLFKKTILGVSVLSKRTLLTALNEDLRRGKPDKWQRNPIWHLYWRLLCSASIKAIKFLLAVSAISLSSSNCSTRHILLSKRRTGRLGLLGFWWTPYTQALRWCRHSSAFGWVFYY